MLGAKSKLRPLTYKNKKALISLGYKIIGMLYAIEQFWSSFLEVDKMPKGSIFSSIAQALAAAKYFFQLLRTHVKLSKLPSSHSNLICEDLIIT
ncbi:hypothetical protein K1719_017295 [Acacia pycnantha]|nr:hypothetical protein K1719_017295 [Acacia pycnantha]